MFNLTKSYKLTNKICFTRGIIKNKKRFLITSIDKNVKFVGIVLEDKQ